MMEFTYATRAGVTPTLGFRSFSYKGLQRCPTSNWRRGTGVKGGFKQEISPHGGARMKASLVKVSPSCRATKYALGPFSSVGGQGYSRSTDFQLKRTPPVRVEVSHGTAESLDMYVHIIILF